MQIKAVLFDLDGTLLNTYEDLADAVNYGLLKEGFDARETENYKYYCGNGVRVMIERALPDNAKSSENVEKVLVHFLEYYGVHSKDKTRVYDGMIDLVKSLREQGYHTAIVTNKVHSAARDVVKYYFGDALFEYVQGQVDNLPTKPDPALVHLVMEKLGVTPNECVFMGDSGVDALTGKNSGAYPVGVLWGFRKADELLENGAKSLINKPDELYAILDELNGK